MLGRTWAIKLGSMGELVPFCERHGLVGLGWPDVRPEVALAGDRASLLRYVESHYERGASEAQRRSIVGQIHRFCVEAAKGDEVVYFDPARAHVVVATIESDVFARDFGRPEVAGVWYWRRVARRAAPLPIGELSAGMQRRLRVPYITFWNLRSFDLLSSKGASSGARRASAARAGAPPGGPAPDPEIEDAYQRLEALLVRRVAWLQDQDVEALAVDWVRARGGEVDERAITRGRQLIEFEATVPAGHGSPRTLNLLLKRYRGRPVNWPTIGRARGKAARGSVCCFVAMGGFTSEAQTRAGAEGVALLEARDFVPLLMSGQIRDSLRARLQIPAADRRPLGLTDRGDGRAAARSPMNDTLLSRRPS